MRILTIQDVSCLGQCSMTVALPILSACGHETCILPTALLSTHTGGFDRPSIRQLADGMPDIREHWSREHITFDAIYTGYLGSVEAVQETMYIAEDLLAPGGKLLVDPAMADHGKLYRGFDESYVAAMYGLCRKADLVLPNVTEAAMLTGQPFREDPDADYLNSLLQGLHYPSMILTGAGCREGETGISILDHGTRYDYRHKKIGSSFHGTGDLFASTFAGAWLRGLSMEQAARLAADMVCVSIRNTLKEPDHWYGVRFETAIPWLISQLPGQVQE